MGLDPAAVAACHRRDRVDRGVVLLHASRRLVAQRAQDEPGRVRGLLAGARRRLLRDEQIHARAAEPAGPSDLAQMAGLLDLDLGLRPAVLDLLRPVDVLPDRSRRAAAGALAGGGGGHRRAHARLDRLRSHLQIAAGQERRAARAGRLRLRRADELGLHAAVLGPRRADPHRRADGDDDDGQRVLRHHAQPAQAGRRADRGPRRPIPNGETNPSSARPTTITSRCPCCS